MESIENIFALEVKKEIAERYFGFRKIIEEDTENYLHQIQMVSTALQETLGHDLLCIYSLLCRKSLIDEFFEITGLPHGLFLDSFTNSPPDKEKIFSSRRCRGLTRKGCLQNVFFDAYEGAEKHILDYRKSYRELDEDHATICAQIKLFYQKNDIHTILDFLRGLDGNSTSNGSIAGIEESRRKLEEKMRIHPPPPVHELLIDIPAIPPRKSIRKRLKNLAEEAGRQQPLLDLRELKSKPA